MTSRGILCEQLDNEDAETNAAQRADDRRKEDNE
jgi:hypothetical protein